MRRATLTLFLFALAAAAPSRAQTELPEYPFRNLVHARSMAMGGAYRALGLGLETIAGNPAAMALYQKYDLELNGAWDFTQRLTWASAGVMDSTNALAAGVGYHLVSFGDFGDRTLAHLNTIAVAMPLFPNLLYAGVSAHYLFATGALQANAVTADAGLVLKLFETLTLGVAGHNLIDTRHPDLATYYTAAAAFTGGLFALTFDARGQFRENEPLLLGLAAGGELILLDGFPVRAGWSRDEVGHNYVSGGAGWMFEGGAVDVAYRHEMNGIGRAVAVTIKISN